MIKVTDILTKPVISLINAKTEGIVKNAVFDKNFKKLKYLVLFDNNEHQEEKALNVINIYSYGENAIVVKEESDLMLEISNKQVLDKPFPINSNVYTYLGKFIGTVSDIVLDKKYNIISLIVNNKEIALSNIISCGQDAVIIQDNEKQINIKNIKRKKNSTKKLTNLNTINSNKVYILNKATTQNSQNLSKNGDNLSNFTINFIEKDNNTIKTNIQKDFANNINYNETDNNNLNAENINSESFITNANSKISNNTINLPPAISEKVLTEINENYNTKIKYKLSDNPTQPQTLTTNYEFLIGRKLEKNIYSSNRELIARKNSKITLDIINKAKLYYKIRELTKYSR